ncbi:MAG: DUF2905 domain-containing protein [Chloroflexi bacterium]|nr:DUF2905 domain-containing protein [Chloroflexota bacterium]
MGDLASLGKILVGVGVSIALLGGLVWLIGRTGLPLGRLPGDIRIERGGFSCFIPLASSIVISLLLTLILNLILRGLNR